MQEPDLINVRRLNRNLTSIENVLFSLASAVEAKDSYTEGHTRKFLNEKETRSKAEAKINPILKWDESEIWKYLEDNNIPIHPWYLKRFSNGKRIRSLGCEPCTVPIYEHESERDGRWKGTIKSAGECGIHTQSLRISAKVDTHGQAYRYLQ